MFLAANAESQRVHHSQQLLKRTFATKEGELFPCQAKMFDVGFGATLPGHFCHTVSKNFAFSAIKDICQLDRLCATPLSTLVKVV